MTERVHSNALLLAVCLLTASCSALLGGAGDEDGKGAARSGTFDPDEDVDRSEPFSGPIVSEPSESIRLYRLNHAQYERTVRDLLRLDEDLGISELFVAEPLITTFDTDATLLTVSADLRRDYERAAETIAQLLVDDESVLVSALGQEIVDTEDAEGFVSSLGERAYRRPLTNEENTTLLTLFSRAPELIDSGDDFLDGVLLTTSYLLQSPHFLYRGELSTEIQDGRIPLNPYEVASKISYALLGSMPDDELFEAAKSGGLSDEAGVRAEARRLLSTEKAADIVAEFHYQLLEMREYSAISKNTDAYPLFGEGVAEDLVEESLSFVRHVVFDLNLGLKELLTAPYTFANERIAGLYGLAAPATQDGEFGLLELPPDERAGLLTQIGFLATHGEGSTPNSILRGVNIAHNVLCVDLPPPPDDVPALSEAVGATNRERIEDLTKDPGCASCHGAFINPLGFAFEGLDGVGAARDLDGGLPVNAASSYKLDGETISFDGPVDLMGTFAESAQAHDCYARHWAQFLYGREIDPRDDADEALIIQGGWLSQSDASVEDLIVELLVTDAFLTRTP